VIAESLQLGAMDQDMPKVEIQVRAMIAYIEDAVAITIQLMSMRIIRR
jgi:hypothetical protein